MYFGFCSKSYDTIFFIRKKLSKSPGFEIELKCELSPPYRKLSAALPASVAVFALMVAYFKLGHGLKIDALQEFLPKNTLLILESSLTHGDLESSFLGQCLRSFFGAWDFFFEPILLLKYSAWVSIYENIN